MALPLLFCSANTQADEPTFSVQIYGVREVVIDTAKAAAKGAVTGAIKSIASGRLDE